MIVTRDKPSQIFAQVVFQCDDNVQTLLPREETPKRTIRYQRPTPPVPTTYADVRLSEEYGIHIPLVTQLGTTSVAWYILHFRLMIVKVNCFLLYKK
jgi:hypothetical protein